MSGLAVQKEQVSVVSYNCLAPEYLHHWNNKLSTGQSAYVHQSNFEEQHKKDLVSRISLLNPDVVCLQEVSAKNSHAFIQAMQKIGYAGEFEQFTSKPDGIATFYKSSKFQGVAKHVIDYQDSSGRKALSLRLRSSQGAIVEICNTHLQGGQANVSMANGQIDKLIQKTQGVAHPVIVCGDMNFTPIDPRFTKMSQSIQDALLGQSTPTSMNGTTALRLDYIWHTNTIAPSSASVAGHLPSFLTPKEPSDHVPVIAAFDIPVPTTSQPSLSTELKMRNFFPGTDQAPSFKRKIFATFNAEMQSRAVTQRIYDELAARFEIMIGAADIADQKSRGQFLPHLYNDIAFHALTSEEMAIFCRVLCVHDRNPTQLHYYNDQPFNSTPSFRWSIFDRFNQRVALEPCLPQSVYAVLALQFSSFLNLAEKQRQQKGGDFLSILSQQIDQMPNVYSKQLFQNVVGDFRVGKTESSQTTLPDTVILVKCRDLPGHQDLYIRGGSAGLSWTHGLKLNRLDWETFEFRTPVPFTNELEYKLLINDDNSKWEEGANHKIAAGKKIECSPSFSASILPPLKKTIIEVDCAVSPGQVLFLSGNGPLGNWDKKLPLQPKGNSNTQWFVCIEGECPSFEYKLLCGDRWEIGPNRRADCGMKGDVRSLQF